MRQGLRKSKPRTTVTEKEVKLKLRKAGLSADGEQRWQAVFSFYDGAEKKISSTGYAAVDTDWDENRIYFVETDEKEGWKLIGSKAVRELALTIYEYGTWKCLESEYNLLKDTATGDYYIDVIARP